MRIDDFVMSKWRENVKDGGRGKVKGIIDGFLCTYCVILVFGETDIAIAQENLARQIYEAYKGSQKASWERMGFPPFEEMKVEELQKCMKDFKPEVAERLRAAVGAAPKPSQPPLEEGKEPPEK